MILDGTDEKHVTPAEGGSKFVSASAPRKPEALPVNPEAIPDQLKALDRWVVWRYVPNTDAETSKVDWDKPPVNARTGSLASSTNSKTWCSFTEAIAAYQRGTLDGIGFVLHRSKDEANAVGFVAIDLDKCRDAASGTIEPWAMDVVRAIASYTEVSPSGRGIRIFLRGKLPLFGRKKGQFEVYETARYVTVTGQRIDGTPGTIEHRQGELETIHRHFFGVSEAPTNGKPIGKPNPMLDLDDAEIVRRACDAANGDKFRRLWDGNITGYPSHSEADLALCGMLAFWTGPDAARIDTLFRQSGLMRPKWDEHHGEQIYGALTIAKALQGKIEFYTPGRNGRASNPGTNGDRHADGGKDDSPLPVQPQAPLGDQHLTDLGNARRVVKRHGHSLRFCHPWRRWLCWDGRRWQEDETAEVVRRVKETEADLYRATTDAIGQLGQATDEVERKSKLKCLTKLLEHCLAWENDRRMTACLEQMKSEPTIYILPGQLDADPFLLNCLNGTLDLRSGELRPHRQSDYLTKLCPVEYRPDAECPMWLRFLDRIMDSNHDLIRYLQRVVGYSLTGDVSEQCLFFFHGAGQNGKSTFLGTILAMLGDYGCQAVAELLMVKNHEAHPTERADLLGKRFVCTIETEEGKRIAEALMKQLTGGDTIRARRMRQDFFEFKPTHKIFLAANHKPLIRGSDFAVWRRIKLVPFTVTIPEEEKDKALPEKLKAELPGILAWAVQGFLDWQRYGLEEPDEVRQATAEYQAEMDSVAEFINECCFVHPEAKIRASSLFENYGKWSGDKLMTLKGFGSRIRAKGYEPKRGHGGYVYYRGLGIQTQEGGSNDEDGDGW